MPRSWTTYAENIVSPNGVDLTNFFTTSYMPHREIRIVVKVVVNGNDYTFTKDTLTTDFNAASNANAGKSVFLYAAGGYHSPQYFNYCEFMLQNYVLYLHGLMINGENKRDAAKMWVSYR